MPSLIGALRISLGLETAAFEKGTKRAAAEVDALGSRAEKAGFAIGRAGKALVGFAGVVAGSALIGGLKNLVERSLEYASSLGETAQQLGVTTKSLQEYRYAASQAGISQDQMDDALAKLTKTMGQAANGAKKPSEAFAKLGIDIKAFVAAGGDAGDLIPKIAEGLAGIASPAQRAAIEVDLFGKAGQRLDPLLSQGAKGVNGLRDAAQKLGIVLSDEQIQKADQTADKISALKQVLEARIAGVVADNSSAILRLAESFAELADKAIKAYQAFERFRNTPFGKLIGQANDLVGAVGPLGQAAKAIELYNAAPARPAGGSAAGAVRPGQRPSVLLPGKSPIDPRFLQPASPSILTQGSRLTSLAMSPFGDFEPGRFAGGLALINAEVDRGIENWDELGIEMPEVNGSLGEFVDQMGETIPNLTGLTGLFGDLSGAGQELKGDLSRAFTDIILHGANFGETMLSVFDRFLSKLLDNVFDSLLGGGGGGGGILGALFGGGGGGGAGLFSLFGFASGTPYAPRGLAVVGEKGPELVNFRGGERVWPNGTGPGGMGNVYHISGNLLTPEFWAKIQAMDAQAASAGSDLAMRKSAHRQSRSLLYS